VIQLTLLVLRPCKLRSSKIEGDIEMKMTRLFRGFVLAAIFAAAVAEPFIVHATSKAEPALYPVSVYLHDKHKALVYPSVAGAFLVYSEKSRKGFSVVRIPVDQPDIYGKRIEPQSFNEVIRYGSAAGDGGIGYVSNRFGSISGWYWKGHGDAHIAIANMAMFRGGLIPGHLNSSRDGRVWCFDATYEKVRHNELLNEFGKPTHTETLGQSWRMYDSNFYRYKTSYVDNESGRKNKFKAPSLFVFDRSNSALTMLPHAFGGAISPDGKRVVFVREVHGNYDLWMQNLDGSDLVQLTSTDYGEYEPSFSPDGQAIAFVSNRDSGGNVRRTSIYIMTLATGETRRITNARAASDGGPAWKDTHTLIFHSNRDTKHPQKSINSDWNLWQVSF